MGFRNIGSPAGEYSDNTIKGYVKIYFSHWLKTYNFENYSNDIFNTEITLNTIIDLDLLLNDQEKSVKEEKKNINSLVIAELATVRSLLKWIEGAFKFLIKDDSIPDVYRFKQWTEANETDFTDATREFILEFEKNPKYYNPQYYYIINNKINSSTENEIVYLLTLMYLDLAKTQEFLQCKFEPLPQENKKEKKKKKPNPYPEIFPNEFSFRLFERLHDTYKDSRNLLADYSFVYRKMYELDYIVEYQKPEMFRDWISKEPYNIYLDNKFKTLDRCTTSSKEDNFNLTLDLIEKL